MWWCRRDVWKRGTHDLLSPHAESLPAWHTAFLFFFFSPLFNISCGSQPAGVFNAHCKPKRNTPCAVKERRYIRGLRGLGSAGLQCKPSLRGIKTISQPRINTDSCQGLLIWEKRRKFACAVLVGFSSYINHSLKVWCVSNHHHAWTVFDKRGNELQLCSPYSCCFSSATGEQPGLFAYKSLHVNLATSAATGEKGKEMQILHKLVCVSSMLQKI